MRKILLLLFLLIIIASGQTYAAAQTQQPIKVEGIEKLTDSPANEENPIWSPDGSKIVFLSFLSKTSKPEIWVMDENGANKKKLADSGFYPVWSPDGTKIAFMRLEPIPGNLEDSELWVMEADGSNKKKIASNATFPSWSPDGKKLAYSKCESETCNIWLSNPDGSNKIQLALDYQRFKYDFPIFFPSWSPDGCKLLRAKALSV